MREILHRFTALFRRRRLEDDLNAELRSHLEMAVEWNMGRGMSAEEARREALRGFGGVEQVKEIYREQRGLPMIETTLQDLHYGFRMLRRGPGFSILAVLCLTLGIGANAAVFSWIEGVLFRPYQGVPEQDRLMVLAGTSRAATGYSDTSWPDFLDFQKRCTLSTPIAEKITGATFSTGERAERAPGSMVSANYFEDMGVRPVRGRGFLPGEDVGRNAHPVVVISYWAWKERFHGDPEVIGKTQILNNVRHTIVGVAPEGFNGTFVGYAFQFWVPASMQDTFDAGVYKLEDRGARWIEGFVRLKPGVTPQQAQEEISTIAKRLENEYPTTNRGRGIELVPLSQGLFNPAGAVRPALRMAVLAVVFVLLIACANVSNLLLARSFARRHEITVRLAVGCGRARLLRQLLTEGLILSAFAAAGGILLANWGRTALVLLIPPRSAGPVTVSGQLDWRVLALSVGVALISTVLFGLAPAIQTSKLDLTAALKSESGGVVGGRGRSWLRSGLVLAQVSLSFVLLVGAGLLIQSLRGLRIASPGFSTDDVVTTGFDLFAAGYDTQRAMAFQDQLADRLQAVSGVQSVAFSRTRPFAFSNYSTAPIAVDGYVPATDEVPTADYNEVSPGYLATLRIPLLSGREFTRADDKNAPLVAVVNETMAEHYWRGQDPVGKRVQVKGRWMRIVGVSKLSKYRNMLETAEPHFYVPMRQSPSTRPSLYIRTPMGRAAVVKDLMREIHALDPDLAPLEILTMREHVDRNTAAQHVAVALLSGFGALALVLAAIGLYGLLSYSVSQSGRELGLRMALGARASDLMQMVLKHGLALTAGGVALGVAVALGTTRLLGYLLYQVSPRDPLAFGSAFVVMTIASLAACLGPAWRAMRTDPVRALRD